LSASTPSFPPGSSPLPAGVHHRQLRRLAFQALFQLDAHEGKDPHLVRASLEEDLEEGSVAPVDQAFRLAIAAWSGRKAADEAMVKLAPTWPAHRQAAADRAILRLAHYELANAKDAAEGKAIINDAVSIAKEFSTDKSPAFINALLDKVYKEKTEQPLASKETKVSKEEGA
jgi:N utilization substance protein B